MIRGAAHPQKHEGAAGMVLVEQREAPSLRKFILIFSTSGHVAGTIEADSPEAACTRFDYVALGEADHRFVAADGSTGSNDVYHVYDATGADLTLFEWADHNDDEYIAAIKALPKCGRYTRVVPAD